MDSNLTDAPRYSDHKDFFGEEDASIGYSRVWFYIVRCHRKFLPIITKALRAEGINDPIWYEVLYELQTAGTDGQTMSALQDKLRVPQYALSRHISRMEDQDLLVRTYTQEDKRKQVLFSSEKGQAIQGRIWQIYFDCILAELEPKISTNEAYDLARDLIKLMR